MSELTLVIGNKNYSSWSLRPWLLLSHFGIEFEEVRIPLFNESTHDKLTKHSPSMKVPVLKHDELVIWDSLAICEYISEAFLDNGGWPKGVEARAVARSACAEMHSGFFAIRNELPMNCRRKIPDFRVSDAAKAEVERIKTLWTQCREQFSADGDWLCGEFSIADCMFAPVILRFNGYGIALSGELKVYSDRMLNHSAIQTWILAGSEEQEVIEIAEV